MDGYRPGKRLWTADDDDVIRRLYPHEPTAVVAAALARSVSAVYGRADFLGVAKTEVYLASPAACRLRREATQASIARRYPKGHVPANKGLRRPGWTAGRMRETQFRKGERQGVAVRLYKPIGTERISKDGYLERKVNDDLPLQRRWRAVHLILWECVNGPVPPGHALTFKNGDRRDVRLENLVLITRRELMARNSLHNLPEPLPQTIQLLGALNRKIRRMTREKQDQRPA